MQNVFISLLFCPQEQRYSCLLWKGFSTSMALLWNAPFSLADHKCLCLTGELCAALMDAVVEFGVLLQEISDILAELS